jgi:PhnB protein
MKLNPHLSFNGQCEAAFKFYESCLHGRITLMMTYDAVPAIDGMPSGWGKKIIHATLALGDYILTGADVPPESYQKPQGFSILLHIHSPVEAESIFGTLAESGTVQLPLQETFWAQRYGILIDQFGIPWSINCGKEG